MDNADFIRGASGGKQFSRRSAGSTGATRALTAGYGGGALVHERSEAPGVFSGSGANAPEEEPPHRRVRQSWTSRLSRSFYGGLRRVIDVVAAAFFLLWFSPVLIACWVGVRVSSSGPGLFWSERVGRDGRTFWMPKFRSMSAGTPLVVREKIAAGVDPVTPFGRFMRRWSIDELPQFWCVLKGEMSLIGPRPLIPQDEAQGLRDVFGLAGDVRPGMTGLAQIKGRNLVTPRKKARYDVYYGRKYSPGLDLMILRATVTSIISGDGVI